MIQNNQANGDPAQGTHIAQATSLDAASYIAQICGELQEMARKNELEMIAYLLAMVRQEALETIEDIRIG